MPKLFLDLNLNSGYERGVGRGVLSTMAKYRDWLVIHPAAWPQPDTIRTCHAVVSYINRLDKPGMDVRFNMPVFNISDMLDVDHCFNVLPNNSHVGSVAAEHLTQCGVRSLIAVAENQYRYARRRTHGFQTHARKSNIPYCLIEIDPASDTKDAEVFKSALARMELPAGLMCSNDLLAVRTMRTLHELGLRVPQDLVLIGVDNDEMLCDSSLPSLSSIDLDLQTLGKVLAERIVYIHKQADWQAHLTHAPLLHDQFHIVQRDSTRASFANDPFLTQALNYIRKNAFSALNVDMVLDHVPVSRRTLENLFRREMQTTPLAYINRQRVQHACHLLQSGNLTIQQIAMRSGYADARNFATAFRKQMRLTPTQYRQRFGQPVRG